MPSRNPFNMGDFARSWACWEPDQVAIRDGDETVTWSQLDERTNSVATSLAELGIKQGDRIAAFLNNCSEFLYTVIAAMKMGAIFVPLNVRLSPKEVVDLVQRSGARVVVTDEGLVDGLGPTREAAPDVRVIVAGTKDYDELLAGPPDDPLAETGPDDPLLICYTSGTTGLPKGATLSHRNLLQPSLNQILIHEVGKSDKLLLPFPLAFTGGLISNAMLAYVAGAELVLERTFDPAKALDILVSQRITVFMAVPVIWQAVAAVDGFADADLSAIRVAKSGGSPVPIALIETYEAKGVGMVQGYALTESSGITTTLPERDARRKIGSAGFGTNGTRLRIVGEDGQDMPANEVGEVYVHGPEVMLGYWEDPDATAETLRYGWLATGDLGRLDEEGHLYIVDRKKDMLISGGLNVYPAEVERVLEPFPGVVEVAVFGVPDERWGEVPAAMIFAGGGELDAAAIVEHCKGELADFKVPKHVLFSAEALPRTMSGKVLKREIAERYRNQSTEEKTWTSA